MAMSAFFAVKDLNIVLKSGIAADGFYMQNEKGRSEDIESETFKKRSRVKAEKNTISLHISHCV